MNRSRILFAALLLAGGTGIAGTFTSDFSTPTPQGVFINGAGTISSVAWMPFIETNRLMLTVNAGSISGYFSPYDLDNNSPIQAFDAKFKLQFGPGSSPPADGLALSFGPTVDQSGTGYGETGAGGDSVAVSFHTYTSNDGPAVNVYLRGTQIAHTKFAVTDMVNSQLQDVEIQLNSNSTLNVSYRGQMVYSNLFLPNWGPTNGYFIFSARTGGSSEETDLAGISINTTLYATPVAPTVTAAPQNITVNEGSSASFSVGAGGTGPFTFQWTKNGVDIPDATNHTMTLPVVYYADNNAAIAVKISNPASTITSPAATLTVIQDTTKPTVTKATADMTFTSILIAYSKPVSDTALATQNYSLDQGLTISTITRVNAQTVKLTTSKMSQGQTYNLTINGVQDTDTVPNTIAANTKEQIRSYVYLAATLLHKKYNNVSDNAGWPLSNLFNDSRYPNTSDRVDLETAMEYPSAGAGRVAADPARNYWDSVEGYFIPPVTTNYVFYTAGADRFALWLSTDEDPANKKEITELAGWTNPRRWTEGQPVTGGVPTAIPYAQSDLFNNTQWPNGTVITLTNGQRYYMLIVHHDPSWCGADDFAVTYTYESEPAPAMGSAPKLTGDLVGFYFDPTGANITFNQQPQNTTGGQGTTVTLSADAIGSSVYGTNVLYQWQAAPKGSTTFTNIPDATGNTYTTSILSLADNGTQFRVIAIVAPITQTSSVATVTVTADTTLPVLTAGAMPDSVAGSIDIGVGFNKPIDASAGVLANYSVAGGTIASLTVYTNRFTANSQNPLARILRQSVLLKVTGLSGNSGVLTVNNITDTYGNKLPSTNLSFTVANNIHWGAVGANELGGTNAVVPVAANGFDVYSDGIGEWANYDEATFVYEQVTGDFDKKLRVEYQDGSSEWARAGLVARDVTNFGVDRATQATAAGRYQKIHVNPVGATLTGPGALGNHAWEGNRRLTTGAQTTSALTGVNSTPLYPNAWCRLQRVGQTFTIYRSDDGITWVQLGQTTASDWGTATPMPDTLYVGPEFSPENGNVAQAVDQGTFLASFRDYGNYVALINPQLTISTDASGKVTLTWSGGTLLSSPTVQGTYTAVQGATSPYVVTPAGGTTFYRVKQ